MSVEKNIRFELIARLCPNATGAELRSVATEAGMFAIRARRKVATERDFLDSVEQVFRFGFSFRSPFLRRDAVLTMSTTLSSYHRQGQKFSSTAQYAQYN